MVLVVLIWAVQLGLILHVLLTRRPVWWVFILLMAPGIGGIAYVVMEILPGFGLFRVARRAEKVVLQTIDPQRDYREAKEAYELAPTIGNTLRLAEATGAQGRWGEAEELYRSCLAGQFADDPAALLGHARALVELERWQEALDTMNRLRALGREGAAEALVYARAAEGLGLITEADEAYAFAAPRLPELEAAARYIRFLRAQGRDDDARRQLDEFDFRLARVPSHVVGEARHWRNHATA